MRCRTCIALGGVLLGVSLLSCAPANRFDPGAAVTKLFQAWNLRQEQVVRDMLADDVQWELMGHTYKGKDEVVQFMAFDDGMGSRVDVDSVTVNADTVTLDLLESNEFMTELGVAQIRNYPRIVFADGKVKHIGGLRPPQGGEKLEAAGVEFGAWVQSNHPEALKAMYRADGSPIISREAGKSLVAMAKEWRTAKGTQ